VSESSPPDGPTHSLGEPARAGFNFRDARAPGWDDPGDGHLHGSVPGHFAGDSCKLYNKSLCSNGSRLNWNGLGGAI